MLDIQIASQISYAQLYEFGHMQTPLMPSPQPCNRHMQHFAKFPQVLFVLVVRTLHMRSLSTSFGVRSSVLLAAGGTSVGRFIQHNRDFWSIEQPPFPHLPVPGNHSCLLSFCECDYFRYLL